MQTTKRSLPFLFFVFCLTACGQVADPATSTSSGSSRCEQLAQLALPNTKITSSRLVAAGTFVGPPAVFTGADLSPFYKTLPAFCRVEATAQPTSDSNIKIEVWMVASLG
jgi:feruloyl esterase